MSAVWLADDEELGRQVAVKMLAPSADRARFEREARAAAALSHPNICALYDYGEADGKPFMVLEYLPDGSLEERLRRPAPLADDETLRIATEDRGRARACTRARPRPPRPEARERALRRRGARQDRRLRHRAHGRQRGTLTEAGTVLGTASYISPEQAAGQPAGPASDVYSFGVILFRMLTGALPFVSRTRWSSCACIATTRRRRRDAARPDVRPRSLAVVTAALAKDPAARPADGAALARELEAMKALYFGTYDREHPRNVNAIAALRAAERRRRRAERAGARRAASSARSACSRPRASCWCRGGGASSTW